MRIIRKEVNSGGSYPPVQTWGEAAAPEGYCVVAEDCDLSPMTSHNGFVTLAIKDNAVTAMEPNLEAWEAWKASLSPAPAPSAAELRERAYDSEALIVWPADGEGRITVTEAARLWTYYTSEGDAATASELTERIAAAKREIRERYPEVSA